MTRFKESVKESELYNQTATRSDRNHKRSGCLMSQRKSQHDYSPITTKVTAAEGTVRLVLALLASQEYFPAFANACAWITFRVRTGPEFSISCWSWNHLKVAGGLETAEQDRLKLEPALMKAGGFGGEMVTSSGPSEEQQHVEGHKVTTVK